MLRVFSRMKLHCFGRTFFRCMHSLNPIQLPAPMETHLWYVKPNEVKSESLLRQYSHILSPCERENVSRMQGEELRKGALLARTLVRTTIARYQINSQIDPRSLKFRKNLHGKPEVHWQLGDDWEAPPLHFNISHTSSLVACGVTINSQIGIDVEEKQRSIKHNILSFARRYFSEYEVQFLASISEPQVQQMEFIKLWTLKEAYVKALGKGFSGAPFKTFTIRFEGAMEGGFNALEDTSTKVVVDDDSNNAGSSWRFLLLELANSHFAAICSGASDGKRHTPGKLMVWKTVPLVEDECVSGTDAVKIICMDPSVASLQSDFKQFTTAKLVLKSCFKIKLGNDPPNSSLVSITIGNQPEIVTEISKHCKNEMKHFCEWIDPPNLVISELQTRLRRSNFYRNKSKRKKI